MATPRDGKPYVWVTWLSRVLAGEASCVYAPWFKAHFSYVKAPSNFNTAAWSAEHLRLVSDRVKQLHREGWTTAVESANAFKLQGKTAVLAGKPDIVAHRDGMWRVVDAKAGQQRKSDWWQVLLYLMALPKVRPELAGLHGEVLYGNGHRVGIEPEELNRDRLTEMFELLRQIGNPIHPPRSPSAAECAWCDITAADCPERMGEEAALVAAVNDF